MRRALAIAAATIVGVAGLAGPSGATTLPVCGDGNGSAAIPGESCEAEVDASAECDADGDVVLEYAVVTPGSSDTTVDLTVAGRTLVDQPLSGSVPWPEGVTSDVQVVFATTPATTVTAAYADECEESAVLASNPRPRSESGVLAATGLTAAPLAIGGGALVAGGAALVLLRRRHHSA